MLTILRNNSTNGSARERLLLLSGMTGMWGYVLWAGAGQGLRITIAKLGYMGSFVSRANPDFCRTVLRLSDSVVTNTAHCYSRNIT